MQPEPVPKPAKINRWLALTCSIASVVEVFRAVKESNPSTGLELVHSTLFAVVPVVTYYMIALAFAFFVVWGDKRKLRNYTAIAFLLVLVWVWNYSKW